MHLGAVFFGGTEEKGSQSEKFKELTLSGQCEQTRWSWAETGQVRLISI